MTKKKIHLLKKNSLFDLKITNYPSLKMFSSHILKKVKEKKSQAILPITMNEILMSQNDKKIKKEITSFEHIIPDGMPLVFLKKIQAIKNKQPTKNTSRIYGPELMIEICSQSENNSMRHYFYGSTKNVLTNLKLELKKQFPNLTIVGITSPPFHKNNQEIDRNTLLKILKLKPDFIWVGLGGRKQISWINKNRKMIPNTTFIAVGAAFDFISKNKRQSPKIIRDAGFEWLFRLISEPKRLFKRYVLRFPNYIYLIFLESIKMLVNKN